MYQTSPQPSSAHPAKDWSAATRRLPPTRPTLDLILGRQRLVDAGFSAIVVHLRAYPPHTRDKVLAELELICGPGRVVGDQVLFSLGQ